MENNINNGQNTVILPTSRPYLQSDGAIHVQLPEPDRNGQVAVPKGDGNVQTLNFYLLRLHEIFIFVCQCFKKKQIDRTQRHFHVLFLFFCETRNGLKPRMMTSDSSQHLGAPAGTNYHSHFESRPNVPRFPGGSSNSNRDIDRLKNQHHEELRRRASYQKIYKEVKDSNDGIQTDTDGFKEPHPRTPHNYQLEKIKKEPRPPKHPTDSDSSDTEDVMTDIVPIPTAPEAPPLGLPVVSQPILAVPVHQLQSQMTPYQTTNPMVPLSDYNNFTKLEPHPAVADASINFDPNDNGLSSTVLPGNGPEGMVIEATKRREIRLQKNREAARECRRKKKEYIKCLENRVQVLEAQNKGLIDELKNLKEMYCHKPAGSQQQ
ncbi:Oidioi.mRNA.OKI2018_I69.XSR.g15082.t1.cds [Oikopleura dioica]|uniref:Oidioi.mRNA.OKI2018_I69.XSR.g15082.t1.cds n=1 Tax=Oikopleura dioica TaxID=34765 RepID=A0ABN7SGS3_OIKDI|nr:Oidioi.mRNA.OKI2018_I69.XSR.g15082.t1.cds [Oikopleura dioica]